MAGPQSHESAVWYVGFGSNLLRERLLAYLAGAPDGSEFGPQAGSSDPSPPARDVVVELPHRLYFGGHSRGWGGGVAFVDAAERSVEPSIGRAYLVTRAQLADITAQENRWPGAVVLPEPGDVAVGSGVVVCEGRYRLLVRLADTDGHEAFTVTSDTPQPPERPSQSYADVIRRGLHECGLSPEAADAYLAAHGG